MSLDWGTLASIVAVCGFIFGVIKYIVEQFQKRKEAQIKKGAPEIILEYVDDFRPNKSGDVITYFLNAKNEGEITAENVEIRLYKVEQNSKVTLLEDRYILNRLDYGKVGDSHPFTFISDYPARPDFPEHLRTPAGRDRIFPRENGTYTFLISGLNFPLITQQLIMLWNEELGRYEIKRYEPIHA